MLYRRNVLICEEILRVFIFENGEMLAGKGRARPLNFKTRFKSGMS